MADLTACSWKKTLPPSSGHTVLISCLFIPRSCCPLSTPRLLTVLYKRRNKMTLNASVISIANMNLSVTPWRMPLTFWRSLCTQARLAPLQVRRTCPGWQGHEDLAGRKTEISNVKAVYEQTYLFMYTLMNMPNLNARHKVFLTWGFLVSDWRVVFKQWWKTTLLDF